MHENSVWTITLLLRVLAIKRILKNSQLVRLLFHTYLYAHGQNIYEKQTHTHTIPE